MLELDQPAAIFADAWTLYDDAIQQLEQGHIRNAAEKAWGATKRATDALILARTGELPYTTSLTSRGLDALARELREARSLVGRYYSRISQLHGQCFYNGICDPVETERRIRETAGYIRDAEALPGWGIPPTPLSRQSPVFPR